MGSVIAQVVAPFLLFFMMAVVGLDLTMRDFRRVVAMPRAVLIGTVGNVLLVPLLTAAVLHEIDLSPRIAGGLILIVAAPGGGISNVFALLAGANTALSVTLTASASILAIVTMPTILALGLAGMASENAGESVPVVALIGQLVVLVLVPIAIGMRIRARRPELAAKHARRLRRIVLAAVAVVIVLGMSSDRAGMGSDVLAALPVAAIWTLAALIVGYVLGRVAGLDSVDCFTLGIELSVKNVGLSAIVALSSLGRPELAIFAAAYISVGYPLAVLAAMSFRRLAHGRLR